MIKKLFKNLCEQKYWGYEAAGAIIFAQDTGKILFLKRSTDEDSEQQQWEFTIGGKKDEEDIDAKANLQREIYEEIGKLTKVISCDIFDIYYDVGDDHKPFKYFAYFTRVEKEFKPILSEEHTDYKWIDIKYGKERIPEPTHFGVERLIERVRKLI